MVVQARRNIFRWSDGFLSRFDGASTAKPPVALTLGYPPSHDPNELVVTAADNRLEAPPGHTVGPALWIHAAQYNSKRVINRRLSLSTTAAADPKAGREASKPPATHAH